MRLFIAVELPDPLKKEIAIWSQTLSRQIPDPRRRLHWVKENQLHLTLKFLGETKEDRLATLGETLKSVAQSRRPLALGFAKVGHFGGRVVWLGLAKGAEESAALALSIDEACGALGFDREARPYAPHITLARAKTSPGAIHLDRIPATLTQKTFGPFEANEISLIQSILTPQGAIYKTLSRFSLQDRLPPGRPPMVV